ncbi:MAG TPA: type II toxin-antitoxin system RatA family toxin [Pseudolabrys sp.]|nr:type II toxin-antitoxin system RatA family toxin [Pseudolabrys sp.]
MPEFLTKRRVRHAAPDMFDLVADIERYPEFVPLCSEMKVRSRGTNASGAVVVVADMTVAYKIIRETFTSRVTLARDDLRILVEYLNGPFKRMHNRWGFRPIDDRTCDIEFFIEYEFKSRALAMLMGAMFDTAFRRFAAAFEKRADEVYGRMKA